MRIPDAFLRTVVYIYPDVTAAEKGYEVGGSGFLVHCPIDSDPGRIVVVTNDHVVKRMPNPVVRINRTDGAFDTVITNGRRWTHHPDGDDISALEFHGRADEHDFLLVGTRSFITEKIIEEYSVGIGDHVAILGRLVGHDGQIKNSPTARFGNIAMMPGDKFENDSGVEQESFLIDCHSVPGFSGSPVFLLLSSITRSSGGVLIPSVGPWLLGIDWMHVNNKEQVRDASNQASDRLFVNLNTGVAGVIPAWRIQTLLDVLG